MIYTKYFNTPLGKMIATANDNFLLSLDFENNKNIPINYPNKNNAILDLTETEILLYFEGRLMQFSIPFQLSGTEFQQKAWNELLKIPYGQTISYQQQAKNIHNPLAIRAVANANSKNKISIIVPCHRVIGKNKKLIGYASGIDKKAFLLNLEQQFYKF